MRTYEEVIEALANDKYEDRILGTPISRFEGLKIAAFIFEKKITEVNEAVKTKVSEMRRIH